MRTVLPIIALLLSGCTIQVRPQVLPNVRLPWQQPPQPRPWFRSADEAASIWANLETPEVSEPEPSKPAEAPVVEVKPEAQAICKCGRYCLCENQDCGDSACGHQLPQRATAAILRDARGQYIVRRGQRCYWSESRKAWREPIKGGCAGGICGYRDIKPGQ